MKSFVNYQKRSVQLPKGCKDLIEVLQPQKQTTKEPPKSIWEMMPISDRVQERGLAHIQRYVSRLWESTWISARTARPVRRKLSCFGFRLA